MKYLLSLSLLFLVVIAGAQNPGEDFSSGLILEDETYDAQARQPLEDGSKNDLPVAVDLSPFCPEIRHQGYIYSCVGWAAGYGALSIQRAILNHCTDKQVITRNAHSALFLYNQIKSDDCTKGSRISDALQFLTQNGDCLARQFDFDINDCSAVPDSNVSAQAKKFAIEDFITLFGTKEAPSEKVLRVKKALAKNKPVVIGMLVLRNFYELKNAQYWHPNLGNTTPAGGHALVVVGYDDQKEAFRLMNSWGKNWGDNGYIWVKYKHFGDFCKYAYVLYLVAPEKLSPETPVPNPTESPKQIEPQTISEKPLTELAGSFQFRYLTGWMQQSGQPIFETAEPQRVGHTYLLKKQDWPVGQLFQLLAATKMDDEYLYVFSVDAQNTVHFHWPRQAQLNEKFEGQNESGLLLSGGEIAIPGPTKALKIAQPGTDRLVMLFSKRKIETIQKLAEALRLKPGDFNHNLLQLLGKYAIPPSDITYASDQIGFTAATRNEGFIVPLVLEVASK
jgi:hypothetical protein